ncbi:MAG: flagellar brake protein [Lachnospiraceae bacterium]|nr:flagellar brake protein [Lachnospiraceae bacterium]
MISSILKVGDRLDIRFLQQVRSYEKGGEKPRILKSRIYDVKKDGTLEIGMPMEAGKLVLVPLEVRYSIIFYTRQGMYQCIGQVKERYKSDNLYMVTMELKTNLVKFQRREFYRKDCLIEVDYLAVPEDEMRLERPEAVYGYHMENYPNDDMKKATAVDISGGGLRMVTSEPIFENNILLNFSLSNETGSRDIWMLGTLLQTKQLDSSVPKYEHRIMFIMKDNRIREEIIRYIFEEERKSRKKEKG